MIKRFTIAVVILTMAFAGLSCTSALKKRTFTGKRVVEPSEDVLRENAEVIRELYGKLKIVRLDDIPEEKYADYKKYVNNGAAYAIVHPSYYLYFHDYNANKIVVERPEGDFSKNITDIFIEDYPAGKSRVVKYMKEMERRERDFFKKASLRRRLVILVLPPDYQKHTEYPYRTLDEFGRYINEATEGSPSIIYVESETLKQGYLNDETLPRLNAFLQTVGVKSLLLGGGYVDLCLRDFFQEASNLKDIETVEMLPEICAESPDLMGQ